MNEVKNEQLSNLCIYLKNIGSYLNSEPDGDELKSYCINLYKKIDVDQIINNPSYRKYNIYKQFIDSNEFKKILIYCKKAYEFENNGDAIEHALKFSILFKNFKCFLETITIYYNSNHKSGSKNSKHSYVHDACLFDYPDRVPNKFEKWQSLLSENNNFLNINIRNIFKNANTLESLFENLEYSITPSINELDEKNDSQIVKYNKYFRESNEIIKKFNSNSELKGKDKNNLLQMLLKKTRGIIRLLKREFPDDDRNEALGKIEKLKNEILVLNLYEHKKQKIDIYKLNLEEFKNIVQGLNIEYKYKFKKELKILSEYGLDEESIAKYEALDKSKAGTLIPEIPEEFNELLPSGYYMRKLNVQESQIDAAVAAILGKLTNCCQNLGGAGESCTVHGLTDSRSGFYILCKGNKSDKDFYKKIIAQSWVWLGKNDILVLDSIEHNDKEKELIIDSFNTLGFYFYKKDGKKTHVGKGGHTLKQIGVEDFNIKMEELDNYKGYRDSRSQRVLFDFEVIPSILSVNKLLSSKERQEMINLFISRLDELKKEFDKSWSINILCKLTIVGSIAKLFSNHSDINQDVINILNSYFNNERSNFQEKIDIAININKKAHLLEEKEDYLSVREWSQCIVDGAPIKGNYTKFLTGFLDNEQVFNKTISENEGISFLLKYKNGQVLKQLLNKVKFILDNEFYNEIIETCVMECAELREMKEFKSSFMKDLKEITGDNFTNHIFYVIKDKYTNFYNAVLNCIEIDDKATFFDNLQKMLGDSYLPFLIGKMESSNNVKDVMGQLNESQIKYFLVKFKESLGINYIKFFIDKISFSGYPSFDFDKILCPFTLEQRKEIIDDFKIYLGNEYIGFFKELILYGSCFRIVLSQFDATQRANFIEALKLDLKGDYINFIKEKIKIRSDFKQIFYYLNEDEIYSIMKGLRENIGDGFLNFIKEKIKTAEDFEIAIGDLPRIQKSAFINSLKETLGGDFFNIVKESSHCFKYVINYLPLPQRTEFMDSLCKTLEVDLFEILEGNDDFIEVVNSLNNCDIHSLFVSLKDHCSKEDVRLFLKNGLKTYYGTIRLSCLDESKKITFVKGVRLTFGKDSDLLIRNLLGSDFQEFKKSIEVEYDNLVKNHYEHVEYISNEFEKFTVKF